MATLNQALNFLRAAGPHGGSWIFDTRSQGILQTSAPADSTALSSADDYFGAVLISASEFADSASGSAVSMFRNEWFRTQGWSRSQTAIQQQYATTVQFSAPSLAGNALVLQGWAGAIAARIPNSLSAQVVGDWILQNAKVHFSATTGTGLSGLRRLQGTWQLFWPNTPVTPDSDTSGNPAPDPVTPTVTVPVTNYVAAISAAEGGGGVVGSVPRFVF